MILDVVKVYVLRVWSFGLTATLCPTPARKAKLASRMAESKEKESASKLWNKLAIHVAAHELEYGLRQ